MRQDHRAGEKLFVDYAGQTVPVVDRETGDVRQAQVFAAVLGASSYTFAEATWTQTLPDWTASHVRAFEFIGGCPEQESDEVALKRGQLDAVLAGLLFMAGMRAAR